MKIYLDDVRPKPDGFVLVHSVNEAIKLIEDCEKKGEAIELISLDHDLGVYAPDGEMLYACLIILLRMRSSTLLHFIQQIRLAVKICNELSIGFGHEYGKTRS